MVDLSGIPKSERELFAKNEEMIRRLLDRQLELMQLKEDLPVSDRTGRNKLQKEYSKINRWLGDLWQAPETYADINMEGVSNKQLGERIHSHTRRVMANWALDTRPSSKGGSSIHHGDSTMQTLGAVRTAPTSMRRDIIQAVKDSGRELATGKTGRNFFDVSEETHPLYHPGEEGKVDYKNKKATISMMPETASMDQRLDALNKSTNISTAASEAADASPPALQRKAHFLKAIILGGGQEILDRFGDPFDRNIRTVEGIQALRPYLQRGLLDLSKGGVHYNAGLGLDAMGTFNDLLREVTRNPLGASIGAATAIEPEAVKSLFQGKPGEALVQTGIGALVGGLSESALNWGMSKLPTSMLGAVNGAVKFAGPVGQAYAGYQLVDAIVEGATGEGFIGTMQQVQDKERTARINQAAVENLANIRKEAIEQGKPDPMQSSDTLLNIVTGIGDFFQQLSPVGPPPRSVRHEKEEEEDKLSVGFAEGGF